MPCKMLNKSKDESEKHGKSNKYLRKYSIHISYSESFGLTATQKGNWIRNSWEVVSLDNWQFVCGEQLENFGPQNKITK